MTTKIFLGSLTNSELRRKQREIAGAHGVVFDFLSISAFVIGKSEIRGLPVQGHRFRTSTEIASDGAQSSLAVKIWKFVFR